MANHVIRFYARSPQPVWDFVDRHVPRAELVRAFGRGYRRLPGPSRQPDGWYLTVVVTTESAARSLREWISGRSDYSFEVRSWPIPESYADLLRAVARLRRGARLPTTGLGARG
jgi:hypothetical protein